MKILEKIQRKEFLIANEEIKLNKLRKEYLKEKAKYKIDDAVKFIYFPADEIRIEGKIIDIRYKESVLGLIEYKIKSKNKEENIAKWRCEKDINKY